MTPPTPSPAPAPSLDLRGLYAVHHGLRRDLARLVAAAGSTPLTDRECWKAQAACWRLLSAVIEDHHTTEDLFLWPVLRDAATEDGDGEALATLDAVEREHDDLEPLLDACTEAYRRMRQDPDSTTSSRISSCLRAVQTALDAHIRREEIDAVPLLHTYMPPAEWTRLDARHFRTNVNRRLAVRLLPWVLDDLPRNTADAAVRRASLAARFLLPLTRSRHRRCTARAVAHVAAPTERRS